MKVTGLCQICVTPHQRCIRAPEKPRGQNPPKTPGAAFPPGKTPGAKWKTPGAKIDNPGAKNAETNRF